MKITNICGILWLLFFILSGVLSEAQEDYVFRIKNINDKKRCNEMESANEEDVVPFQMEAMKSLFKQKAKEATTAKNKKTTTTTTPVSPADSCPESSPSSTPGQTSAGARSTRRKQGSTSKLQGSTSTVSVTTTEGETLITCGDVGSDSASSTTDSKNTADAGPVICDCNSTSATTTSSTKSSTAKKENKKSTQNSTTTTDISYTTKKIKKKVKSDKYTNSHKTSGWKKLTRLLKTHESKSQKVNKNADTTNSIDLLNNSEVNKTESKLSSKSDSNEETLKEIEGSAKMSITTPFEENEREIKNEQRNVLKDKYVTPQENKNVDAIEQNDDDITTTKQGLLARNDVTYNTAEYMDEKPGDKYKLEKHNRKPSFHGKHKKKTDDFPANQRNNINNELNTANIKNKKDIKTETYLNPDGNNEYMPKEGRSFMDDNAVKDGLKQNHEVRAEKESPTVSNDHQGGIRIAEKKSNVFAENSFQEDKTGNPNEYATGVSVKEASPKRDSEGLTETAIHQRYGNKLLPPASSNLYGSKISSQDRFFKEKEFHKDTNENNHYKSSDLIDPNKLQEEKPTPIYDSQKDIYDIETSKSRLIQRFNGLKEQQNTDYNHYLHNSAFDTNTEPLTESITLPEFISSKSKDNGDLYVYKKETPAHEPQRDIYDIETRKGHLIHRYNGVGEQQNTDYNLYLPNSAFDTNTEPLTESITLSEFISNDNEHLYFTKKEKDITENLFVQDGFTRDIDTTDEELALTDYNKITLSNQDTSDKESLLDPNVHVEDINAENIQSKTDPQGVETYKFTDQKKKFIFGITDTDSSESVIDKSSSGRHLKNYLHLKKHDFGAAKIPPPEHQRIFENTKFSNVPTSQEDNFYRTEKQKALHPLLNTDRMDERVTDVPNEQADYETDNDKMINDVEPTDKYSEAVHFFPTKPSAGYERNLFKTGGYEKSNRFLGSITRRFGLPKLDKIENTYPCTESDSFFRSSMRNHEFESNSFFKNHNPNIDNNPIRNMFVTKSRLLLTKQASDEYLTVPIHHQGNSFVTFSGYPLKNSSYPNKNIMNYFLTEANKRKYIEEITPKTYNYHTQRNEMDPIFLDSTEETITSLDEISTGVDLGEKNDQEILEISDSLLHFTTKPSPIKSFFPSRARPLLQTDPEVHKIPKAYNNWKVGEFASDKGKNVDARIMNIAETVIPLSRPYNEFKENETKPDSKQKLGRSESKREKDYNWIRKSKDNFKNENIKSEGNPMWKSNAEKIMNKTNNLRINFNNPQFQINSETESYFRRKNASNAGHWKNYADEDLPISDVKYTLTVNPTRKYMITPTETYNAMSDTVMQESGVTVTEESENEFSFVPGHFSKPVEIIKKGRKAINSGWNNDNYLVKSKFENPFSTSEKYDESVLSKMFKAPINSVMPPILLPGANNDPQWKDWIPLKVSKSSQEEKLTTEHSFLNNLQGWGNSSSNSRHIESTERSEYAMNPKYLAPTEIGNQSTSQTERDWNKYMLDEQKNMNERPVHTTIEINLKVTPAEITEGKFTTQDSIQMEMSTMKLENEVENIFKNITIENNNLLTMDTSFSVSGILDTEQTTNENNIFENLVKGILTPDYPYATKSNQTKEFIPFEEYSESGQPDGSIRLFQRLLNQSSACVPVENENKKDDGYASVQMSIVKIVQRLPQKESKQEQQTLAPAFIQKNCVTTDAAKTSMKCSNNGNITVNHIVFQGKSEKIVTACPQKDYDKKLNQQNSIKKNKIVPKMFNQQKTQMKDSSLDNNNDLPMNFEQENIQPGNDKLAWKNQIQSIIDNNSKKFVVEKIVNKVNNESLNEVSNIVNYNLGHLDIDRSALIKYITKETIGSLFKRSNPSQNYDRDIDKRNAEKKTLEKKMGSRELEYILQQNLPTLSSLNKEMFINYMVSGLRKTSLRPDDDRFLRYSKSGLQSMIDKNIRRPQKGNLMKIDQRMKRPIGGNPQRWRNVPQNNSKELLQ